MPTCKKCERLFPHHVQLDGKRRNLCNRKFCLECSPFGGHNTIDLTQASETERACSLCKETKPLNDFYQRRSPGRYGKPHAYCKQCANQYAHGRQKATKLLAINYKGGECMDCGYKKYAGALDFHHRNPAEKDFKISGRASLTLGPELKRELDKCDLLCANCHRERHGQEHV